MPASAEVRAKIDARVKEEASAIYAAAGLTLSDAVRMMLLRTVAEHALPLTLSFRTLKQWKPWRLI